MTQVSAPVAVITGASSGIGLAAAQGLAQQGWRIIGVGRNPQRCEAAQASIAAAGAAGVDMLQADISLMAQARRVADEIARLTDRVQVLINNAGGMASDRLVTSEGLGENFAANHLGPFLLTNLLLPLLRHTASDAAPGDVRIINTSSDASEMIPGLPWDDLQSLGNYSPGAAYCNSKLANVMFARALAQRLASDGIAAFAVHPGTVDSNFISHVDDNTRAYIETLEMISPAQAAQALVWLATADAAAKHSGQYFHGREEHAPNPLVEDEAAVNRLWEESAKLAGC